MNTQNTLTARVANVKSLRANGHFKRFSQRAAYEIIYIIRGDYNATLSKMDETYYDVRKAIHQAFINIFGNKPQINIWCGNSDFYGYSELDYAMHTYFNVQTGDVVKVNGFDENFGNLWQVLEKRNKQREAIKETREKEMTELKKLTENAIMQEAIKMMEADAAANVETTLEDEEEFFMDL